MKSISFDRIERALFGLFLFFLPFQTRVFLRGFGVGEWQEAWLWVSDIIIVLLAFVWFRRGVKWTSLWPMVALVVFVPALVVNPTPLAFWRFIKIAEGLLIVSYVRAHAGWLIESLARPWVFTSALFGLLLNSIVGIVQFAIQKDLSLQFLGESPLGEGLSGVANFAVGGAKVVRAYGLTPHPNILAVLLGAGIAVVVFLYLFRGMGRHEAYSLKRQREEILRGVILFTLFLGILLTFSRAGWLATALGVSVILLAVLIRKVLKSYRWEVLRISILMGAIIVFIGVGFLPLLYGRVTGGSETQQAVTLRNFYATEAQEMIKSEPLTGVGLGGYTAALRERNPDVPEWSIQPVHNVALLIAAEAGFPAMAILVSIFVLLIIDTFRKIRYRGDPSIALVNALVLGLSVLLLVSSLTDHLLWTSQQGTLLFWVVVGLMSAQVKR